VDTEVAGEVVGAGGPRGERDVRRGSKGEEVKRRRRRLGGNVEERSWWESSQDVECGVGEQVQIHASDKQDRRLEQVAVSLFSEPDEPCRIQWNAPALVQ